VKILLFGKYGQLGWELERTLACLGSIVAIDYPEVDFKKPETLPRIVQEVAPELIINAVAYTNVDKAESEINIARIINATSVGVLAEQARKTKIPLIHYSTDYVFDGKKCEPYTEEDRPNPINAYGQTKLEGERAILEATGGFLILRTSWVYSLRKGGFVNKVLEWSRTQKIIRVVDDQIGNPTWARMLAEATAQILSRCSVDLIKFPAEKAGLYHLAGSGAASRYDWAREILNRAGTKEQLGNIELLPAKSAEFQTIAWRPSNSSLDCEKFQSTFKVSLPDWRQALDLAFDGVV
jgi:dTDP-4-dehydrorhamnose reductase